MIMVHQNPARPPLKDRVAQEIRAALDIFRNDPDPYKIRIDTAEEFRIYVGDEDGEVVMITISQKRRS